jgi:hypothetical protein
MSNEAKIKTGEPLYGTWIWEGLENDLNKSIIVSIDEKQVIINWLVAGIH